MARFCTLKDFQPLSAPEQRLVDKCRDGEACVLGDGTRPGGPDTARTIRADLLRYLILGGCDDCRVDEWGVQLVGAYVTGQLDLSFAMAKGATALVRCHFETRIQALNARFQSLNFDGSFLPGLMAQGIEVTGHVFLRSGFTAKGEVSLAGARIAGQLSCIEGSFGNEGGDALNAETIEVTGDVFLCDGFTAKGGVSLSGAKIGGQLACDEGRFENEGGNALNAHGIEVTGDVFLRDGFTAKGRVSLSGAKIGGQLACIKGSFENEGGDALYAGRIRVGAQFFWRGVTVHAGVINLAAAHVGDLVDDAESWPGSGRLVLDGFTYDRIGAAATDANTRLKWLAKGDRWNGEFFPQPYTQLAKVLREMGHDRAARVVRMAQERLVRQHIRETARIVPNGDVDVALKSLWADARNLVRLLGDWILRWVTGYGHAPVRSAIALAVLFLIATSLANRAWNEGSFAPNSGPILVSTGWTDLADDPTIPNPAKAWSAHGAAGQDWESFNRYAYGFDVVVPILTLGQTEAWAPSTTRGAWGWRLWWARWVLSAFGWIVTALGAAAITGIIRRE